MGKMGLFDLEGNFAFYGAYHSNPVNKRLHMLFVWPNFFSALILFHFTPPFLSLPQIGFLPSGFEQILVLNFGFLLALIYAVFFVLLDKRAGSLAALLCLCCWVGSCFLASFLGFSLSWKVVLGVQLICWTGLFIGHGVFERRAPTLFDNVVQPIIMAPFFVLLEVLQITLGYEPYPGFSESMEERIGAEIEEWRKTKQKKIS